MSLGKITPIPIRPIKIEEKCDVCYLLRKILLKLEEINQKVDLLI